MAPIVCSAAQATFFAMPNQFDLVAFDSPKEIPVHTSLAAALKPLRGHKQVGVHTNPAAAFIKPPRALRRFLCTRALLQPSDLCEAPGKSVCTRALLQLELLRAPQSSSELLRAPQSSSELHEKFVSPANQPCKEIKA